MRVLSIYTGKGGIGKTTFAQNLAYNLAVQGRKVGVVDTDRYAMTSNLVDMRTIPEHKRYTLTHVVRDGVPLIEAMYQARKGLYVVPSDTNIEKASNHIVVEEEPDVMYDRIAALRAALDPSPSIALPWRENEEVRIRDFKPLERVSAEEVLSRPERLDYLIFDFAPDPGALGRSIIRVTDEIWSPLVLEPLPVQGFAQMGLIVKDMFKRNPGQQPPIRGVIPFVVNHKRDLTTQFLADLYIHYPETTTRAVHDDPSVPVSQGQFPAQTLFEFKRSSRATKEIFELALLVDGYQGRLESSPACDLCAQIHEFAQQQLAARSRKV